MVNIEFNYSQLIQLAPVAAAITDKTNLQIFFER
jgi:hypothetical protein